MNNIEIENRGLDEDFFSLLCKRWGTSPTHHTLGMNVAYLGKGEAGLKMSAEQPYTTVHERLHGGIIATLADTAMGWAIITLGRTCVTVDMYLNYLAPVFKGTEIIAEGIVIHSGQRTVVAEATLYSDKGELVAKSRGTFALRKTSREILKKDNQ